MKNGALVISLDFELLWGVFDKVDWREKKEYFKNTRELIPQILQLFDKYNISCTWATVGMLFNENWEEWNTNKPDNYPEYSNAALSAYKYGMAIQSNETEALCFAPGLINQIKNTPLQEVATHTYSHYYCLEKGQTIESFETDLRLSIKMAKKLGVELKSLVFPRNQFNEKYLEVCKKQGIQNVRSNPSNWYWKDTKSESLINKVFRTGDAYIGPNNKSYKLSENIVAGNHPFSQKASRLLRPYYPNKRLNTLKLKRIKNEMTKAAKAKEFYHLWWHPHNFGDHPQENLKDLEELLMHFDTLRQKYGYISLNMCETGKLFGL
ncbi:polysaccharide deacetylase [Salegentibacter sp. 24]|uniref:polysaccharide deacetylase family protein n=1 Tax=Salegentibacter sp. 24 TaxID=2183986 RepID=UPI00105DE068|nr:polysaccharide deacetylase family protein [Salegentibacter sp. 24]TDN82175.1 polysaccharide deacetylase [Salegentibacter sp. 24]